MYVDILIGMLLAVCFQEAIMLKKQTIIIAGGGGVFLVVADECSFTLYERTRREPFKVIKSLYRNPIPALSELEKNSCLWHENLRRGSYSISPDEVGILDLSCIPSFLDCRSKEVSHV